MADNEFGQFQTPLSPLRFQSQLGKEARRRYNEGKNVIRLSLARVVKVNYKYNTVDVVTILHRNALTKNPADGGKFSARLPVQFGGKTPDGKVYGANTLVTEGSLVLVGFLEGNKDYPIVLNIYGDTDNQSQLTRTTFTGADATDEDVQRELWQLFTLYPSMTYTNTDGNGNKEVTFSGKSFMYITDTDPENHYVTDESFDYDHLPSSRYANGDLIEPKSPTAPTVLYVHQGVYGDHRVTFFIKSDGTVRLGSRHKDGEGITFQELKTDGSFSVVQKNDTTDPEAESHKFSQFQLTEDGNLLLQSQDHKLEVTSDKGVLINGRPILTTGGGGGGGDGGGGGIPPGGGGDPDFDLSEIEAELEALGKEILSVNSSIDVINGRIRLKADAVIVDNLNDLLEIHSAAFEVIFDRIEATVTRKEIDLDLDEIREQTGKLLDAINTEIEDILGEISGLDEYLEGAFRDGIIEESEAHAIYMYIDILNTEKVDVDVRFNDLYFNHYLSEEKAEDLWNAKVTFDARHIELIDAIEYVVTLGKVGEDERVLIDTAFENYRTSISELSEMIAIATEAVVQAMAKEAEDNAKNYTEAQVKILADEIRSKVESETFEEVVGNLESSYADIEEQVANTKAEVEAVSRRIPFRAEIISTQGNIFKNGMISTTLFCRVYRGDEEVTDQIEASRFRWTRVSDDPEDDNTWNTSNSTGRKTLTLTPSDVHGRATFNCDIFGE